MLAGAAFLRERTMSARAFAGLILTVLGVGIVALKPEEQESAAAKEGDDGKARAASGGRLRRGYVMMMLVRPNVFFSRPRSTVCKRGQIQRLLGRSRC